VSTAQFTDALSALAQQIDLMEDYNPPPISTVNVGFEYSAPSPTIEVAPPAIDFESSGLLQTIITAAESVIGLVDNIVWVDTGLRVCFWLKEVSVIFAEKRRDMSSNWSKFKKALALLLKNSNLVLFLGLFVLLAIVITSSLSKIDLSSFSGELTVACHNVLVVDALKTQQEYATKVNETRTKCDVGLQVLNNRINIYNNDIIGPINAKTVEFENYYISNGTTGPVTYGTGTFVFKDFAITRSTPISYGEAAAYTVATEIENYKIDDEKCEKAPENDAVVDESNKVVRNMVTYVLTLFWITLVLNICCKLIMVGIRTIAWMDLTKGYDFDKGFNSAELKAKIRGKYRLGAAEIILAIAGVIVTVQVAKWRFRNMYEV